MKLTLNITVITQLLGVIGIAAMEIGKVLPDTNKWKSVMTTTVTLVMALNAYLAHGRTPNGDKIPRDVSEDLRKIAVAEDLVQKAKELK